MSDWNWIFPVDFRSILSRSESVKLIGFAHGQFLMIIRVDWTISDAIGATFQPISGRFWSISQLFLPFCTHFRAALLNLALVQRQMLNCHPEKWKSQRKVNAAMPAAVFSIFWRFGQFQLAQEMGLWSENKAEEVKEVKDNNNIVSV